MSEVFASKTRDDIDIQAARKYIKIRMLECRCVVRIQAAWRGWINRMTIAKWKLYHIDLRLLEDLRAIQIQDVWRGYDARRLALELSDCLKKESKLVR